MAFTDTARSTIQSASDHGQTLFDRLRARFSQHRLYRRTVQEMHALSNRELADLGLHRSEIPRVARQAVYDR